jgi:putative redox protein
MDASVTWQKELEFSGTSEDGHGLTLGGSSDSGDRVDGFGPMELVLLGLAGCTGMDVISILQKKAQVVTAFAVEAHADRAREHPKVFTSIHLEYRITGNNLEGAAVARAIELSQTKYCPAFIMLSPTVPITSSHTILESG